MNCGLVPPTYVRNVTVHNNTGRALVLNAQFEENQGTYNVAPGETLKVEFTVDKGTWTAVDPIKKLSVQSEGAANAHEQLFVSPGGVVCYTLNATELEGNLHLESTVVE